MPPMQRAWHLFLVLANSPSAALKGGDVAKSIDDLQKLKDAHQENSDVYKNIINQVNTLSGAQQTRPIVPASR